MTISRHFKGDKLNNVVYDIQSLTNKANDEELIEFQGQSHGATIILNHHLDKVPKYLIQVCTNNTTATDTLRSSTLQWTKKQVSVKTNADAMYAILVRGQ